MPKYLCKFCKQTTASSPCEYCGKKKPGRPFNTATGKKPSVTLYPSPDTLEWIKRQPDPYGVTVDKLVKAEKRRRNE